MNGSPGALVFKHDGNDQLYVFVAGDNGGVQVRFWNVPNGEWQWDDRGRVDGVSLASPSAAHNFLNPDAREGFLLVFARGDDGTLYEQDWDSTQWLNWTPRGQPVWNVQLAGRPATAAFLAAFQGDDWLFQPDVLAFGWGDDNNLYRYSRQHDRWSIQGAGPQLASDPAAIVQAVGANTYIVHAYVIGDDGNVWVSSATDYTGQHYAWHDLGAPGPAVTRNIRPGLASLGGRLRSFVRAEDGHLWANSWGGWNDASAGRWIDLGVPPGAASVISESSPVVFNRDGIDFTYTFHVGDNGHLYQRRWDGAAAVLWDDFGQPATDQHNIPTGPNVGTTGIASAPAAVAYTTFEPDPINKMFAFVIGNDNHLHHCFWDGDAWLWNDLGADPNDA